MTELEAQLIGSFVKGIQEHPWLFGTYKSLGIKQASITVEFLFSYNETLDKVSGIEMKLNPEDLTLEDTDSLVQKTERHGVAVEVHVPGTLYHSITADLAGGTIQEWIVEAMKWKQQEDAF